MQNLSNKSEGRNEHENFSGLSLFFKRLIICFFKFVSKYVEKYGVKITIQSEATDKESVKIGKKNTGIERKKKEMEGKRIERLVEERLENDILIEKILVDKQWATYKYELIERANVRDRNRYEFVECIFAFRDDSGELVDIKLPKMHGESVDLGRWIVGDNTSFDLGYKAKMEAEYLLRGIKIRQDKGKANIRTLLHRVMDLEMIGETVMDILKKMGENGGGVFLWDRERVLDVVGNRIQGNWCIRLISEGEKQRMWNVEGSIKEWMGLLMYIVWDMDKYYQESLRGE